MATGAFIGRARELGRLEQALEAAAAGTGATMLVAGEAGIGKTRLAAELAARARDAGFEILVGRCLDLVGSELAYQPFVEALRELPVVTSEGAGSQQRVFADTLAQLAERAGSAPVLLVLEDLHWADASTLDLVVFLAHNLDAQRVLLLATYRADELASAERVRRLEDAARRSSSALLVELGPLGPEDVTALLEAHAGATQTAALTQAIVARSEGNPFFAEELLAAAGDGGIELPRGLSELLLRRVALLDGTTRDVLRLAAAAGRDVGYQLLHAAAELPERELRESLRRAVEHGVLVADQRTSSFRFRHALLAEAIYATLLPGEREQVHGRLAEELARGEPQASPAELAPHWEAAGRPREALTASIQAASESEAAHGLAEALAHLERALRLWNAVPDAPELTGLDLVELCSRAAELASQTGGGPRAVALMERAIELVGENDPVRAALLYERLGRYLHAIGDSVAGLTARERAVELVPAEPPSRERAEVLAALAQMLMVSWRPEESLPLCEEALALARAVGARTAEYVALATYGILYAYTGHAEEGLAQLRQALALAEEDRNGRLVEHAYTELTETLTMLGRPREAARLAVEALAAARHYGVETTHLVANQIEALVALGEWDEAERVSTAALRVITASYRHRPLVSRAELEVGRGAFDAARAHLEDALAAARGDSSLMIFDALLTELALWERRWTDAEKAVHDGLMRARVPAAAPNRVQLCAQGLRARAELAALARARRDEHVLRHQLAEARKLRSEARGDAPEAARITPNAAGWAAQAEAEYERARGEARPDTWAQAAKLWEKVERAPLAAYCRWRQAEALVEAGSTGVDVAGPLSDAHTVAAAIGARPLLRELELLAERAGVEIASDQPEIGTTDAPTERRPPAPAQIEYRILGPLEVRDGDRELPLGGGKQRALLALLLVNANRTLGIDQIVDDLWGDDVPESAPKMVQIYVSKLRKLLPPEMLHTRPPGYVLVVEPDELDLREFERLVAQARAALEAGLAEQASDSFRAALELWRGPALAEFSSEPFAPAEAARLEDLRVFALEGRLDADLLLGRHGDLVGELDVLVARYPLREGFRRQHMLALYRSGRQAEALAAYQDTRRALAGELGIEPSPALRELERRILQQDAGLDAAVPGPPPAVRASIPAVELTTCPSCGAETHVGTRFCPSCGTALAAAASEEMLKLVTVLFADVVGSTALAESRHPEDVRDLMTDYFTAMAATIREEGGTVEKFVGDAIMAVFGVPSVHEDDAVRAVRAAWRMLERLRSWNDLREPAQRLEIRVGVTTGDVLASGARGGDLRVTGDAVNVAARLQQAAEPGTIVVADRTARLARSHFELCAIDEPLALKGKSEAVTAWLVKARREVLERRETPVIGAPLVGREHELMLLRAAWARVCSEGRPHLVTLLGDAGVGKSRLVREFVSKLGPEAKVLVGRCLPYGDGVTLWPLAEILKAEAGILDTDPADVAIGKIARLVETTIAPDSIDDHPRSAAALASTLGVRTADDPLGALDPRDLYRERIAAWRALLTSVARSAPVVAVVEDIHWADATMLDILDELAERLEGPTLFVCPARPDLLRSRPDWGGGRRSYTSLPLDPLRPEESARLVSALLDAPELPDATRARILERSEGNPFFLEEIIRHLVDDGTLVYGTRGWQARPQTGEVQIPDSVQAVILARLDLLSPDEKRVAQSAAVIGRVFWGGAVSRIASIDDLDAVFRTLLRREFVLERVSSSIAGQEEYSFKHVLIRDVAYESLPRKERSRAHVEAAAWIEETSGDRAAEFAELLAHHYDAAFSLAPGDELRRKARRSFLTAAGGALRRFAIEQAERFARRAVELSEGGAERVEALEGLGDLQYIAFNGDEAFRAYRGALDELRPDDPAFARLAGKAALVPARWVGTTNELAPVEEIAALIDAGLEAAPPSMVRERTLLLIDRGCLLAFRQARRDAAAGAAVREAERAAEALGDANLLSAALDLVSAWEQNEGRIGAVVRTTSRRVGLVPRMSDVKEIGDTYAMAAEYSRHLGRYVEAEAWATECIERSRGIDSGSYVHGLTLRVAGRFMLGKWDEALDDQAELELLVAQDPRELPPGYTMRAYTFTALCHELRGETDEADRYIEVSRRYVDSIWSRREWHSSVHTDPLALTLANRGLFDEALAACPFVPHTWGSGLSLAMRCEVVASQGDWDEAARVVAAARDETDVGEQVGLPRYADRLEGRAAAAAGDHVRAAELLRRSADGFAALGAQWEEAWSRLLLAEVVVGSDRQHAERELAAALPVFERLRSVRELQRARALLADAAMT
jgi:predicted ATPase/class 3 adenylate cyclase/DNA-binding SARP family transcriptional activator